MKNYLCLLSLFFIFLSFPLSAQEISMEDFAKFSFPSELVASGNGEQLAWAMNEQGKRNIYLAKGPDFNPKRITDFNVDDGQEISSLQFSPDGSFLVFVRGGDHGGGNADRPVNPLHLTDEPEVEIYKLNLEDLNLEVIGEGDDPIISVENQLAYEKNGQVWVADLENNESTEQLFEVKGRMHSLEFSPDGEKLLFVSDRGDYSIIGVFEESRPIQWLSPGFYSDQSPRWSPDGKKVVYVRTPGGDGAALPILEQRHSPWEIRIADLATGESFQRWKAPETLQGSVPTVDGRFNLHWAADDRLVYLSYEDGWPHLYSMDAEEGGSELLTPGDFHVEHVELSPDGERLIFSANGGPEPQDLDRRHIGQVAVDGSGFEWRTTGEGIEAHPVFLGDEGAIAFLSATAKRPLLPAVQKDGKIMLLGEDLIPEEFPQEKMVVPTQVSFLAPDGTKVYGQLFEKEDGRSDKPGVVFVHGGPQRQMLLGWSYMDYYSNTYAINQYLANAGFVVLSVNYRLGIGYGYDFHKPADTYYKGAAEYQDVKAAGEYLAGLPQVNAEKIGVYGGSYGGYLTALALGKDSDLFKVGVDVHGVHDFEGRYDVPEGFEVAPDYEKAKEVAWKSSPFAYLDTWKSPVLFIHGDDDRNVNISHTVDLIRRFDEKNLPYEFLMVPNETHHWMKFSNMVMVDEHIVNFLEEHLLD